MTAGPGASPPRAVILGVGNTLLGDDGVGVLAARRARELLAGDGEIEVREAEVAGFALVDLLDGFDRAVLIDALTREGGAPGHIEVLRIDRFEPTRHLVAGHQIDLPTAVALGRQLCPRFPSEVLVVAVLVEDVRTLGAPCTAAVARAVDEAARRAIDLARSTGTCAG